MEMENNSDLVRLRELGPCDHKRKTGVVLWEDHRVKDTSQHPSEQ